MKLAFYDAEHAAVGPCYHFPDWTADDARLYAMTIQDDAFDHQDWLLVWDENPAPGSDAFRSVFFLGGIPWDITEPQIEQAFAQVIGH